MFGSACSLTYHLPRLHEFNLLTFDDRTMVSNAYVQGHFVVFGEVTLGCTRVSGVVHDGA